MPGHAERVLIVGGGVGGLSTAIALRQAGIDAVVFERASEVRKITVGGGFTMWPNSMRALEHLGLNEKVRAVGASFEESEFRNWRGRRIAVWPVGEWARKYGTSSACVDRADLVRVLAENLDDGVLHLGAECTGFTQDETGVTARFKDGREERGDVLVGADAINSVIRAQLFGKVTPRYAGYVLWQGYILDSSKDPAPQGLFRVAYGRGLRYVFHHVGQGRLFWQSVASVPEGTREPATPEGRKDVILDRHRGWLKPTEEALEATDAVSISRMDIYFRNPSRQWGHGRVTLVGDAAHPILFNLGQGAAQSVEDAVVLARRLKADGDVPAALRAYEQERMDRAIGVQKLSKFLGRIAQMRNPVGCEVRDLVLPILFNTVVKKEQEEDVAFKL